MALDDEDDGAEAGAQLAGGSATAENAFYVLHPNCAVEEV